MTSHVAYPLASQARVGFVLASGAVLGMLVLMLSRPDGSEAIALIAGFPTGDVSDASRSIALACDTLLPIGYASGLVLLTLDRAGARVPLAMTTCAFTLVGVTSDFLENGFAVAGAPLYAFTVAKYGSLAIAGFLLGGLVWRTAPLDRLAAFVMQAGMPFFFAIILSGLLAEDTVWVFAVCLLGTFILGALIARPLSTPEEA